MKHLFYFMLGALLLTSCATTKTTSKVPSPIGDWDYAITGTPEGNFSGVLTITEINNVYTAKMASGAGDLMIEKFTYDKTTMKVAGELDYSGTLVLFDAVMNNDEMTGAMSAGGMGFPFKATRKK